MDERFFKTQLMFGEDAMKKLQRSNVAIFGVGGVGGYVVEILARAGISNFSLIDNDIVSISNINRQIFATTSTIGTKKIEVAKKRILDINPKANIEVFDMFYLPENANDFDLSKFDFVIDCIDTVSAKIELALRCKELKIPIISSMGSRNRLDYSKFVVCDLFKTKYDNLAKIMRRELKKRGIKHLKVISSTEDSNSVCANVPKVDGKYIESSPIGPSLMGIILAGEVIKEIISDKKSLCD